jgi:hypothetical protein
LEPAPSDFVQEHSVVRRIWGDPDCVLLIFGGCAAEFALNRAVDWLFFTGKLPAAPIARLFSTAAYAREIVFSDVPTADRALERIRAAHTRVEEQRSQRIPDWAHRDVLYMLIDYSERAFALLGTPLSRDEQDDLYDVFYRVGTGLGIPQLPPTYAGWKADRELHLHRDLTSGALTETLYRRYRGCLGSLRYRLLLQVQSILCPRHVVSLLRLRRRGWLPVLLRLYRVLSGAGFRPLMHRAVLPREVRSGVGALNHRPPDRLSRHIHAQPSH